MMGRHLFRDTTEISYYYFEECRPIEVYILLDENDENIYYTYEEAEEARLKLKRDFNQKQKQVVCKKVD